MEILKSIAHPDEVYALVKFKVGGCEAVMPKCDMNELSPELRKCYEFLNKTSRSFAAVIQALDGELRHAICLFYLVLRALDTVEDDMTIPLDKKIPMLKAFHQNLTDPQWKFMDSQEKDRVVLEEFPVISAEFRNLKPIYQDVISDICQKMGRGMTVYLDRSPDTMEEWNEYCHYVAGLVGIGLSQLFSASELEDPIVGEDKDLANSMGLFLQKTNIIRDYLEDVEQSREFWPRAAWGKYAENLVDLSKSEKRQDALYCLNELITNAMEHIPDVIKYMSRIRNQSVFNFCAIPQVMAIGTLERCYNNPHVLEGVVKIRKGEAVRMMMEATDLDSVKAIMTHFTLKISRRIPLHDPLVHRTRKVARQALELNQTDRKFVSSATYLPLYGTCALLTSAILWHYWTGVNGVLDQFSNDE